MLQKLLENLHLILPGIALVLWALSRLVDSMAKRNPEKDKWDELSPRIQWASDMYCRALDWLIQAGYGKWSGAEKLKIVTDKLKLFEKMASEGHILEAIADVTGFARAAEDKMEKKVNALLPFVPRSGLGMNLPEPAEEEIQENSPASLVGPGIASGDGRQILPPKNLVTPLVRPGDV